MSMKQNLRFLNIGLLLTTILQLCSFIAIGTFILFFCFFSKLVSVKLLNEKSSNLNQLTAFHHFYSLDRLRMSTVLCQTKIRAATL